MDYYEGMSSSSSDDHSSPSSELETHASHPGVAAVLSKGSGDVRTQRGTAGSTLYDQDVDETAQAVSPWATFDSFASAMLSSSSQQQQQQHASADEHSGHAAPFGGPFDQSNLWQQPSRQQQLSSLGQLPQRPASSASAASASLAGMDDFVTAPSSPSVWASLFSSRPSAASDALSPSTSSSAASSAVLAANSAASGRSAAQHAAQQAGRAARAHNSNNNSNGPFALTSDDFWHHDQAPSFDHTSLLDRRQVAGPAPSSSVHDLQSDTARVSLDEDDVSMDFDELVHDNVCGPSSGSEAGSLLQDAGAVHMHDSFGSFARAQASPHAGTSSRASSLPAVEHEAAPAAPAAAAPTRLSPFLVSSAFGSAAPQSNGLSSAKSSSASLFDSSIGIAPTELTSARASPRTEDGDSEDAASSQQRVAAAASKPKRPRAGTARPNPTTAAPTPAKKRAVFPDLMDTSSDGGDDSIESPPQQQIPQVPAQSQQRGPPSPTEQQFVGVPPLPANASVNQRLAFRQHHLHFSQLQVLAAALQNSSEGNSQATSGAATPTANGAGQIAPTPSQSTAIAALTGAGAINLVAKDAVVASRVISRLTSPPRDALFAPFRAPGSRPPLRLLVLGVPKVGAKSRVETQIKVSLVLVREKPDFAPSSPPSLAFDPASSMNSMANAQDGDDLRRDDLAVDQYVTLDGELDQGAGERYERVGTFSDVRLPGHLALKKKQRGGKPDETKTPDPMKETSLSLEVAVVRATEPYEEISICEGCQQRERKRAQRKKDAKSAKGGKSAQPAEPQTVSSGDALDEAREREKVVVFNCMQTVDFKEGETVLPTRITCYCRHHKEKTGFCVIFRLKDTRGNTVAEGITPPILITDDHKASNGRGVPSSIALPPNVAAVAAAAAAAGPTQSAPPSRRNSGDNLAKRSQRSSRGRVRDGSADSEEDSKDWQSASAPASRAGSVSRRKPYEQDGRPRKRPQPGVHKSPSFAMTPLTANSKTGSPQLRPLSDSGAPSPSALVDALGQSFANGHRQPSAPWSLSDAARADLSAFASVATPPLSPGSLERRGMPTSVPPSALQGVANGYPTPLMSMASFGLDLGQPRQAEAHNWPTSGAAPTTLPKISRLLPCEGPTHGGIEVTILGENFQRDQVVVFGDTPAVPTHFWSETTLICLLPPSPNPGPVVVGIKGVPLTGEDGTGLQLFTYRDDTDRSLLELALQVVGLKMTGKIEDAANVARRIVGSSAGNSPQSSRHSSPGDPVLMAAMDAAGRFPSPASTTRPSASRGSSYDSSFAAELFQHAGETRSFEAIVLKFLLLLDLDMSLVYGSGSGRGNTRSPLSFRNRRGHTLLHLATMLGFHRLAQFLIVRGIDINARDRSGFTALHFAALHGRVAITRMLLDAGAIMFARNVAGKTAPEIAHERDDVDVYEVFSARQARGVRWQRHSSPNLTRLASLQADESKETSEESDWESDSVVEDADYSGADYSEDFSDDLSVSEESSDEEGSSDEEQPLPRRASTTSVPEASPQATSSRSSLPRSLNKEQEGWSMRPDWANFGSKTPSSPPPKYTPSAEMDEVVRQAEEKKVARQTDEKRVFVSARSHRDSKASLRRKLARRAGCSPEDIPEDMLESYMTSSVRYQGFSHDKMLIFFWIPILILLVAGAIYSARHAAFETLDRAFPNLLHAR